jgi:hypothetical protein
MWGQTFLSYVPLNKIVQMRQPQPLPLWVGRWSGKDGVIKAITTCIVFGHQRRMLPKQPWSNLLGQSQKATAHAPCYCTTSAHDSVAQTIEQNL